MLYAFMGYPPIAGWTVMDLQRVARSVLVAHPALVAVDGETGLALGRPFGRPHVAFVVAASHWSSMMIGVPYPAPAQPNPADLTLTSRNLPYRTQPRLIPTKHTRGHLAAAHQNLPGPISPDRNTSELGTTSRTVADRIARCALAGVSLSTPERSRPRLSASHLASPQQAKPDRIRIAPLRAIALAHLATPQATMPHQRSPQLTAAHPIVPDPIRADRTSTDRISPRRSSPYRKRKNPNTCALVGLLKTHGGCTDVRIVDHEPQQNSPRDVSLQQVQYTRNGRPCQQGVACERT